MNSRRSRSPFCVRQNGSSVRFSLSVKDLVALSESRTPKTTVADRTASDSRKRVTGSIRKRSVHQRNLSVGGGYPRPMTLTQNRSLRDGERILIEIGTASSSASI